MPHELMIGDLTEARKKRLQKNVAPATEQGLSVLGVNVLQKNDPVLLYLAMSDESEYEKMIQTDIAISGAIEQRVNGLVSQGWEIVPGESQSERALELADFVKAQFDAIPKFGTLRRELLRAIFYGWRPALIDWTSDFEHKGRPYFAIARIRAQKPWHYEMTVGGDLVFTGGLKPLVLPDPLQWMACTAGSTESPYGEAWLRRLWMLYFVSKKVEKMSAQAIQRSLGIIKAKQVGGSTGALGGKQSTNEEKVASELSTMLDRLNAHNILMELNGWSIEFLTDISLTDSYAKINEIFDTKKRTAIVLQNLTSEIRGFGSRAAAEQHAEILQSVWMSDAEEECDWYNDGIIRPLLAINFGAVDSEDCPKFRSKIFSRPDVALAQAYVAMGGELDGRRLASTWNLPAHFEDDDSPVVLKKPMAPALMLRPDQDGEDDDRDDQEPDDDRTGQRTARAHDPEHEADAADSDLDRVLSQLGKDVGDELGAYYRTLAGEVVEANPDPKA